MNLMPPACPQIRPLLAFFVFAAIATVGVSAATPASPVASKVEVEKVFGKFVQAWHAKDLNAVVASFTADAVAFDPVGPGRFENTEGIRGWVADTFKMVDQLSIELRDLRVQTMGPVAWLTAAYVFKGQVDGKPLNDPGNVSMIWVKQPDGSYKSPLFHASPIPPPPPTPSTSSAK